MRKILLTAKDEQFKLDKYVVFDIESDGLLDTITTVHCICTINEKGEEKKFGPRQIKQALAYLSAAPALVGHNILGYDLPALEKVYGWTPPKHMRIGIELIDTEVLGRIHYPSIKEHDYGWARKNREFHPRLFGRHSLEAWGYRLGYLKGTYGKTTDFKKFTNELLEYCMRDVKLTDKLLQFLIARPTSAFSVELEHLFSVVIDHLMASGVKFDVKAAEKLTGELMAARAAVADRLLKKIPPFVKEYVTPKKQLKRIKTTPFNPGSRTHIAKYFMERHGWKPRVFTEGGRPKVDEKVLKRLAKSVPIANELLEHFLLDKRLSQIAEGKEAWLKKVKPDGRIYGRVNHCGANTSRCTHSGPNLAQVPRVGKPYGKECRSLFIADRGYKLIGTDAKGIDVRVLADCMAEFDGGAYVKKLLEGDIHNSNMKDAGLKDRDQTKTFFYALLYGAGPTKIGSIIKGTREQGQKLIDRFMTKLDALAKVKAKAEKAAKKYGMLLALDNRRVFIRKKNSALNARIQAGSSVVVKIATVLCYYDLVEQGLVPGVDFRFVLHVHDEYQIEAKTAIVNRVKKSASKAIEDAGTILALRCPLAGSTAVGQSWAETH